LQRRLGVVVLKPHVDTEVANLLQSELDYQTFVLKAACLVVLIVGHIYVMNNLAAAVSIHGFYTADLETIVHVILVLTTVFLEEQDTYTLTRVQITVVNINQLFRFRQNLL
jgi:uncharacterized protein (DUF983 family)